MSIVPATSQTIHHAAEMLRRGDLVAFPTETVYGLGADASNPEAVRKIFTVKGRPSNHPVIVHLASAEQFEEWARDIPEVAYQLAETFMPGALTLILKRSSLVPDLVTGGQDTVGLRVPNHPVALELLRAFGGGVAAPSANRFGRISPTTAQHVFEDLGHDVSLILEGGACSVGLESTIVDVTSERVRVLRPGGVGLSELARVLGYTPEVVTNDVATKAKVRVSGSLESHYAPITATFLVTQQNLINLSNEPYGVIALQTQPAAFKGVWLHLPEEAERYGQRLYAALRELDTLGLERILIENVPEAPDWLAVRDRLQCATASK
jgi:L-threonylcarbamoyladenylate synthase